MKLETKKAALELSVSTVVIIVISVSMLILGLVLVRSIMCGAIGLTGEINDKTKAEINKLFGAPGEEVVCIGSGEEPVTLIPGKLNNIHCGIRAPTTARYSTEITSITGGIKAKDVEKWIDTGKTWSGSVSPGDELPKKILRLNIPDNAPEGTLYFQVTVKKDNAVISTQDLDFEVRRVGWMQSAVC